MLNKLKVKKTFNVVDGKSKEEDNNLNQIYYLYQNKEKCEKPQFLREYSNIQCSDDFPNIEFRKYIDNYYNKFSEEKDEIKEKYEKYHIYIEWLTISGTEVDINNVYLTSKIQMTNKSVLNANYSIFIPHDLSKTESAIEIFANSKAIFKNCYFKDSPRIAVLVRDFSTVIFEHCLFENNCISCFLMNDSYAEFIDCKFKNDKNISIFNTKNSHCKLIKCNFNDLEGKSIFSKDESVIYMKDTKFNNCKKGAATIAEKSKIIIDGGVEIINSSNTALRSIMNSQIKAHDLKIKNTDGNCINMEDSKGYFVNCEFDNTEHPTIAVIGHKSNPIFNNCKLYNNKSTFCVVCKNGCRPLFDDCQFYDCETNCFSISDFSQPHIQNCYFENIDKYFFNLFGCSHLTFDNIKTNDDKINIIKDKICVRKSAKCENKKLDDIELNTNENDDDDKDNADFQCKSWVSPNYILPKRIEDIEEPNIIRQRKLHHLKILNTENIKEIANKQKSSMKCCHCHKEMTKDDHPNILTPCGHLICNECKDLDKRCPICDTRIKKCQKIFFEEFCALCLENKSNTISLPCGHLCMCYECAMKNSACGYNCPMCNENIINFKFIFDDDNVQNHHIIKNRQNQNKTKKGKFTLDNKKESELIENQLPKTKSIEYNNINENANIINRSFSACAYI